jgi:hypothetical protein
MEIQAWGILRGGTRMDSCDFNRCDTEYPSWQMKTETVQVPQLD